MFYRYFIIPLILVFSLLSSSLSARQYNIEELVKMSVSSFQSESETYLAITLRHQEGWHTYWKNPGDSGLATKIEILHNAQEIPLQEMEWPAPKRYLEGGQIEVFAHADDKTLFFKFSSEQLKKYEAKVLEVKGTWLMCSDICIPGQASASGTIQNGNWVAKSLQPFVVLEDILERRLNNLPQRTEIPRQVDMVLAKDPQSSGLILYTNLPNISADQLIKDMNVLTPFRTSPLDFRTEEIYKDKENNLYLRMKIDWDGIYQTPPQELPADGKFTSPLTLKFLFADPYQNNISVIEKKFHSFSLEAGARLENFHKLLTFVDLKGHSSQQETETIALEEAPLGTSYAGLFSILIFALFGGFILNLMPCVLPVISLKLFSLVQHRGQPGLKILRHNLAYTLGVIFTFWILAAIVIFLKSIGEGVGWGFQLQSPTFVALMVIAIFVLALNMFGLFEFATPGGQKLGDVKLKEGLAGDFLSGVLATILSTPCSAPFLGTALTFAFTSSNLNIFLILSFVGLGLALPFLLTGFFPALISFLPRPGMWMDHFKKFLGLTLILTCLWLLDVYGALIVGSIGVLKLQTLLALIFFAFFLHQKMTRSRILQVPLYVFMITLLINTLISGARVQEVPTNAGGSALLQEKVMQGLEWQAWSEEKMAQMAQNQELVFIDFTAKWCLTCKVNERLVINTNRFKQMVADHNIKLLLADWTRRDAYIGDWLKSQGMVGVPAYFIQRPDGTLINLGETLSFGTLEQYFKNAHN